MDRCPAGYNAYAIYKTVKSDVLETNKTGQLYRYCWLGKLFYRAVDWLTHGAFSRNRIEKVQKAVQKTFDDLSEHLEKCIIELKKNPAFIEEVESQLFTYSIYTAKQQVVHKKPYRLLATRLQNLTDLENALPIQNKERVAQLVQDIQNLAKGKKLNDEGLIGPINSA